MIVLDTSSVLPWFFPDEYNEASNQLQLAVRSSGAFVPSLWYFEVANSLLIASRRDRILKADIYNALASLDGLPIEPDQMPASKLSPKILKNADKHNLSAYDATYLELAIRRSVPLATLDRKLAAAATTEGITVFGG